MTGHGCLDPPVRSGLAGVGFGRPAAQLLDAAPPRRSSTSSTHSRTSPATSMHHRPLVLCTARPAEAWQPLAPSREQPTQAGQPRRLALPRPGTSSPDQHVPSATASPAPDGCQLSVRRISHVGPVPSVTRCDFDNRTRVPDAPAKEVAVTADPELSQGGKRNSSAHQRCRIVLTERCSYVT
jgi:hypothetical protein